MIFNSYPSNNGNCVSNIYLEEMVISILTDLTHYPFDQFSSLNSKVMYKVKRPENWKLVEMYDGNLIFEDTCENFSISIDDMGYMEPKYQIIIHQLKEAAKMINFIPVTYSTSAQIKEEALYKAYRIMHFLNSELAKK